ncbi:mothers against decapentaplegic homolog 6-like isoform X2 [Pollicipes pollicipes]|uniref:mothers against decapentaplegic homolog 6-like isoform X2 n=1 Tax=Pollicipes pollicipes TaxID=41117 RepID=UPI0018855A2D|nr:mothers against decapentaplegic homolog 6-like isoform X2 [Pollicipes pollicipes]
MWKKLMQPIHRQRRIQRLIRLGVSDGVEAECAPEDSGVCATDSESERELVRSLLSTLHIDSLKMLCEAVESGGDSLGACVVVPKREYVLRSKCATAVVLFCRYFRWPDVDCELRLRRLLVCQCVQDDCQTCINPYHWSRVYTQDSPPPPVAGAKRSAPSARHQPDGSELAEPVSVTTGGTGQYGSTSSIDGASCRAWCRLFYFERRRRVGQLGGWAARGPVQHVFYSLPHGDGLALEAVVDQNPRPEPDVRQTRALIGAGLTLSLEPGGVWLYNRSRRPLFVSSPTLDPPRGSPAEAVHKLLPGFSVLVFAWAGDERRRRPPDARDGPRDPHSVTVSFAKGWGPKYTRRSPTECPCWLELCFSPLADRAR